MNKVFRIVFPALVLGILVFGPVWAEEGGGGGPSYGPGTVPTIPGTDVPVPAGDAVVAQDTVGSAPPAEGGSEGEGADAGTYVETRKDKVVFETTCLKCHPKEKILKRRTEPQWKDVVLVKHLLQGKIDSSVAAPVLRYLNENYGVKTKTPTPTDLEP